MTRIAPVTPGELLLEEFLKPLGITKYRLAKEIGVPAQRIGDIVAGKRVITADISACPVTIGCGPRWSMMQRRP
ncbi:HigA family addiction module antitoxin [Alloalcanivorax mobilis]|uniref:HigA family addiction module antitoxin n=1 Tax=Alloalcanivorax mobilis TaxID=2019569 RepID=UPI001E351DC3|nr:HigA family addiction module antitoxin [Alloalcanivorax mobilis]